ncbi:thiamine ABC transporter ATP-binding protein ThiQ [Pelagibius litoralis]|uniref:Thiamine ABC transporter ATP-binding protein ThiQ n=1 Tax=Pelagibius litoralis TaxID=374515 RepID=A0A967EX13_9PROT|nr:thiamine ABC transporter ATP-binding protein ThiQ [Pelagibius litoralis]NIA67160.1 thiamine ABC transporter ATP-binding protein ThiQ [Pelagibius litoralis]
MLEVSDLTFRYEDLTMVFDLSVVRGECLALLGPSGGGKSTLLNLIAGFEKPLSGRIMIDGRDVTALSPAERPVTSLFQEHNLFAHLSVAQNVGLGLDPGLRLGPAERETVRQALVRVELTDLEHRLPAQLSGGQRQRVALARSLVRRRPLLLLDEPFSALDPGLRLGMLDLVDRLRREQGLTVVLVSHNPQDALRIAARTAFLSEGRILAQGPTENLLSGTEPAALRMFLGTSQSGSGDG